MKKLVLLIICLAALFLAASQANAAVSFVDSNGNLITIDDLGIVRNLGPTNGGFGRACVSGSYSYRRAAATAFLPGGNNVTIINNNNNNAGQMQAAAAAVAQVGRRGRRGASAAASGNGAAATVTFQRRGLFGRRSITTASAAAR